MNSKCLLAAVTLLMCSTPALAQKANIAHGADIFKKANCVMCHSGGDNLMVPDKPIKGAKFQAKYPTDASIAKRIREGSTNGMMPPFAKDQISDKELVDLIGYVRSLTPSAANPAATKTPATKQSGAKKTVCPIPPKGKH